MQALMAAQSGTLYHAPPPPALSSEYVISQQQQQQQQREGSPRCNNVQSSDSDSDDISKSLSYLLNQHINQSASASVSAPIHYHGRQQPTSASNGGGGFLMPGGYGSVISMPNPLDSLSLDLPIHPPQSLPPQQQQQQHQQPMLGIGHLMTAKDAAAAIGFSTPGFNAPSSNIGTPQFSFLGFSHPGSAFATPPPPPQHQPQSYSISHSSYSSSSRRSGALAQVNWRWA
ncbi:hypothetical protein GGI21_004850 [Coemansia aciculifera]|nr:hypothetical protein GGI21_004850 [Coemansia aciculifera]